MRVPVLVFLAVMTSAPLLLMPFVATASDKAEKTVTIKRDVIRQARGNDVLSGDIIRVGHEVIYIETEDGRKKIDVDDISFPEPIKSIFDEQTRVIATGKLKGDEMVANRIVAIREGVRRVFISNKPVEITIKGEKDIKVRVTP